jgi:ABC-2 type transport system permease protein
MSLRGLGIRTEFAPMLRLAAPVVLAELGWMFMGVVDTLMVGRLGPQAIGAVGVGSSLFMALAIFGLGILLGLDTLVSHAYGARRLDECHRWLFDGIALAVALSIPLMFVCVLLGAGLLALEREENAFGRLVRGLVSRWGIIAEKAGIAAVLGTIAAALTLAVLVATGSDVAAKDLLAGLVVVVVGGVAFGALGVALGAAAREVRAASLLAVLVLLPIAVIGLIPVGLASPSLYDAIRVVSGFFPFRAVLNGIDEALRGQDMGERLLHLAGLLAGYVVLARVALRRFG